MEIDLTSEQLRTVYETLERLAPNVKAAVFGSRLGKSHHPYSDLDLALMSDHPIPLLVLSELEEAFSQSDLPFKVDIVDLCRTTPEFRSQVEQKHIPI